MRYLKNFACYLLIFILCANIWQGYGNSFGRRNNNSKRSVSGDNASSSAEYDDSDDYEYEDYVDKKTKEKSTELKTTTLQPYTAISARTDKTKSILSNFVQTCPQKCVCLDSSRSVECSNLRLFEVPHALPIVSVKISLSHNAIARLEKNSFSNCTKIREIDLSYNQIHDIHLEAFNNLHYLDRLRLDNNQLTQLNPDSFIGCTSLSALNLSSNPIYLNQEGSFLNQPSLLELSCQNCSWTQLYDDTFKNLSSLNILRLDNNDFGKQINTLAFVPLKDLIKLRLPELDEINIQKLCNLLKSIDNISFKHFDVSCYELVLGTSFNDSIIGFRSEPVYGPYTIIGKKTEIKDGRFSNDDPKVSPSTDQQKAMHASEGISNRSITSNATTALANNNSTDNTTISLDNANKKEGEEKVYQVPVSEGAVKTMLISIMVIAFIGILIGIVCRKDIGGIKTKCCRTRKPEVKDPVHPTEEIPLNTLA